MKKLAVITIVAIVSSLIAINITFPEMFAIVYGAVISAFIGIMGVYLSGKIREQEWRKENVYKPLYNELNEIITSDGRALFKRQSSKWEEIDSYSKLRVDKDLCTDLNNYEKELAAFKKILGEYNVVLEKSADLLEDAAIKALQKHLTIEGRSIILEGDPKSSHVSIEVKTWVGMFKDLLLSCKNGSDLYNALVKYSEERKMGHERYFREWYFREPKIFDNLAYEFTHLKLPPEHEIVIRELEERKEKVVNSAKKLKAKLEKRIKKIW